MHTGNNEKETELFLLARLSNFFDACKQAGVGHLHVSDVKRAPAVK